MTGDRADTGIDADEPTDHSVLRESNCIGRRAVCDPVFTCTSNGETVGPSVLLLLTVAVVVVLNK